MVSSNDTVKGIADVITDDEYPVKTTGYRKFFIRRKWNEVSNKYKTIYIELYKHEYWSMRNDVA